ncbi:Pyrimidine 5'-nucleotidase (UMHypothetical protein-1) [Nesidiocoris tenuis]|uniref:5'-nucleotidase n=1 Tax=Nesidiocoris tenuis TaxID=355587 RepID=A0ABN7BAW5_9HEMI|nr:Pyrimidine 5'-nucleotidase (UMHypothetical protein-1) [Nesidiocoris tenuis]
MIPALESKNVRMKNKAEVYRKIEKLVEGGFDKLQIITDFDRTLSKYHHNGEIMKSSYMVFETIPVLPPNFISETDKLYKKFRAIEDDPKMTIEQKLPYMEEWWRLSERLFVGMPCNQQLIKQAVIDCDLNLRTGTHTAFNRLREAAVPILVFSAGLGDVVKAVLEHEHLMHENVHVVSNFFRIENNQITSFLGEQIHIFNKNQHAIENTSYFQDVSHRPNVILMGDSLGDANMDEGVHGDVVTVKIGFLSVNMDEYLPQYLEKFDIVLLDDQTMDIFNAILDQFAKGPNICIPAFMYLHSRLGK